MNNPKMTFEKNDLFNRKTFTKNITEIVFPKGSKNGKVIAIDSSWGTGKTQLINMWKNELDGNRFNQSKNLYKAIYFDAWRNDDWSEPLTPLIHHLDTQENMSMEVKRTLLELSTTMAKGIGRELATVGVNLLADALKISKETRKGIKRAHRSISKANRDSRLLDISDEYEKYQKNKSNMVKFLATYQNSHDKTIVFFIDELDRCRPSFAVQLLEVMKHFFSLENFIFVISCDLIQLSHTIKVIYGDGFDSLGYLDRFFDYRFNIPAPSTLDYVKTKVNELDFKIIEDSKEILNRVLTAKLIELNFTIREINKLFTNLEVLYSVIVNLSIWKKNINKVLFYSFLMMIKLKKPDDYAKLFTEYAFTINDTHLYIKTNSDRNSPTLYTLDFRKFTFPETSTGKTLIEIGSWDDVFGTKIQYRSKNDKRLYAPRDRNYVKNLKQYIILSSITSLTLSKLSKYFGDGLTISDVIKRDLEIFDSINKELDDTTIDS